MPSSEEAPIVDELKERFSGWENRVENEERYNGWELQAAHLHERYDVPQMRACVVALKQQGASTNTIASLLDRTAGTISGHFSAFKEFIENANELREVMGPHPWDYDGFDPNMWLPLAEVSYRSPVGERELKLFVERYGNAVENEYLFIDRRIESTQNAGETKETVTRSAMSGTNPVIQTLSRTFWHEIDAVAHLCLLYNGYFDPQSELESLTKQSPSDLTNHLAEIEGDTERLENEIERLT